MNLENRKLFVFDLDGTLLNSDKKVSKENYEALLKAKSKGHLLTIATGRNYLFAKNVIDENWNIFDYFIGCNGALFHDIKNYKYYNSSKNISFSIVEKIMEQIEDNGGGIQVSTVWNMYADFYEKNKNLEIDSKNKKLYFDLWSSIKDMDDKSKENIMQISVFVDSVKIKEFHKKLVNEFGEMYDLTITSKNNIDINFKDVNKLLGIKHVAKRELVSFNNVYVFGDSENDIPGILYYNNTYVMNNGLEDTKKVAKEIIDDNNTNSIAQVIIKNI